MINGLKKLWQGKIIAGTSAGVHVLSKYYYSARRNFIGQGFGILPIKVICHYSDDKKDGLKQLEDYGEKLKI